MQNLTQQQFKDLVFARKTRKILSLIAGISLFIAFLAFGYLFLIAGLLIN